MSRLSDTTGDQWNDMADAYKKVTTDVSVRPISAMLERANALLPFAEATGILDNGCGPGPIMTRILQEYDVQDSCSLICSDFSEGMIKVVQDTKAKAAEADVNSAWNRVETVVQDAMNLSSIGNSTQSHVTAGWVYFMTPDPQKCLSESRRVLKDGGVLVCSSWQGSQWIDLMNLLPKIRPDKKMPEVPREWRNVDLLKEELKKTGFKDVEAHQVETKLTFDKMEPMIDFMLTKMPHMAMLTKDMSEEEVTRFKDLALNEGQKMCPNEPGEWTGVALVAAGRK